MNMFDPRHFLLPSMYLDPTTSALLGKQLQATNPGKMTLSNSFRISDILDNSEDAANTSGESETNDDSKARSPSVDSRGSPSGSKKSRKARTIFTDKQLQELENMFEKHKYLNVQDRMDLAHRMGLTDTQVKTWYQNRRTKWKRQASVGMELLNEAGNLAAVQQLIRTNPYWANYMQSSFPGVLGGGLNFMMLPNSTVPSLDCLPTPPTSLPGGLPAGIPPHFTMFSLASPPNVQLPSSPSTPNAPPVSTPTQISDTKTE